MKVGPRQALPPGTVAEFEAEGATYAICNLDGQFHCIEGVCPHAGGPLGQGNLNGTLLVCPWHGWRYDVTTGVNELNPSISVQKYQVKVEGDDLLVSDWFASG